MMKAIEEAVVYATRAHAGVNRKGKTRPYILHPLEVMVIASSLTEDESVLAAAVLHDVVEDTERTAEDIEKAFGKRVAELVMAESEDKLEEMPAGSTWKIRKEVTINHLCSLKKDAKIICLGDKLSSMREISRDYALLGDQLWERFNQKDKNMHRWYYSSIYTILKEEFGDIPALREYRSLLEEVFDWKGSDNEAD